MGVNTHTSPVEQAGFNSSFMFLRGVQTCAAHTELTWEAAESN